MDVDTLGVTVDGEDVTSTCETVEGGSECVLDVAEGGHTVHAQVSDRAGNVAEASVDFTVDTIPPAAPNDALIEIEATDDPNVWRVVGSPGSVEPGSTVIVRNTRTGEMVLVTPGLDGSFSATIRAEPGDVLSIAVVDRAGNTSPPLERPVVSRPPQTEASGFIHGSVIHSRTLQPLSGVRVSARGVPGGVFTDAAGRFVFATPGTGRFTLFFERRGFITARRDQYVLSERQATVGDVHLTSSDTRTALITSAHGGTLTDSTGKVQVLFPPGAVAQDLEVTATYFGAEVAFPVPTPEGTVFLAGAQMTPEHTNFLQPVTVRIANDLGFAPGTQVPFAFASHDDRDPNEGYYDPGMGTVTADGAFIEFSVTHFSCVSLGVAPPPGTNPGDQCPTCPDTPENEEPECKNDSGGSSSICISDGNVRLEQRLASVFALGRRDALEFRYTSATAYPRPLISARSKLSSLYFPTAPAVSTWKLSIEGVDREVSFQGTTEETHFNYLWDGVSAAGAKVPTGVYHFKATSTGSFSGNLYTSDAFNGLPTSPTNVQSPQPLPFRATTGGFVIFNDQAQSPFGAGWGLAELERFYAQPDGTVLWTDGRGASKVFRPEVGVAGKQVVRGGLSRAGAIARDGAGNLYVGEFNGTIHKFAPDGTTSVFATVEPGLSSLTFDRSGNLYALIYFGALLKITPAGMSAVLARFGADLGDMVVDRQGSVFVLDSHHPAIYKVTPQGQFAFFAGYGFGNRLLTYPSGIAMDEDGNLYVSNNYNNPPDQVRCGRSFISKISPQGAHSYYAVGLNAPRGMTFDDRGNLYVADVSCGSNNTVDIKVISPTGVISPVDRGYARPVTGAAQPFGYSFDLVTDPERRLYLVTDDGTVYQSFIMAPPLGISVTYSGPAGDYSTLVRHLDGSYTRTLKDASRIEYNAAGLQTAKRETTGDTTSYVYDAQGRLTSRVNAVGQEWRLTYSGNGLESVVDPVGRVTLFTLNAAGELVEVKHPDNSVISFDYNSHHLLTGKTDARNFTTTYEYDALGKASRVILPTGETRRFEIGRIRTATNDLVGGLGTPQNPAPPVRAGDIEDRYVDGKNQIWRYLSNRFGSVVRVTRPDNVVHEIERDEDNNPIKFIEPNGGQITQTFDSRGNLVRYDQAGGLFLGLEYHPVFNKVALLQDVGGTNSFQYDSAGNLIQLIDARSAVTRYEVDRHGLPTRLTLPDGGMISYIYDALGRLTQITDPIQRTTRIEYDNAGNVTQLTDAAGKATRYLYDSMNRQTATTDDLNQTTSFVFQAACTGCDSNADQLINIIDAKTHTTSFTYDAVGKLDSTTDPLARSRTFIYDLNRNLAEFTDPKGQTTTFDYDVNNRLIRKNLVEGPVEYGYDVVGNLIALIDQDSSIDLSYDVANRLVAVTSGGLLPSGPLGYTYDRRNLRTSLAMPWDSLEYEHDGAGDLRRISGIPGPRPFIFYRYDPMGRRVSAGGLLTETLTYDPAGQLTSWLSEKGGIFEWEYSYDLAGNRLSQFLSESALEPVPEIFANQQNAVALTPQVVIQGHTTGAAVRVNGQPIFVNDDGNFATLVSVNSGPNVVTVEATRPNGATAQEEISVIGEPAPAVTGLFSVDTAGTLYGFDQDGRVVRVSSDATMSVIAGVDPFASHVARGADGNLYAWYGASLKRLDGANLVLVAELPFVPEDVALLPGDIWLVSQSPTLYRFNPVSNTLVEWVSLPIPVQRVALAVNVQGEAVVGTGTGQLFRIDAAGQVTDLTAGLEMITVDDVSLDSAGNAFLTGYNAFEDYVVLRLSSSGEVTNLNAFPTGQTIADGPGNLFLIGASGLERVPAGTNDAEPFLASPGQLVISVQIDPPRQTRKDFTYDRLDRLTGAIPGESYAYDAVGNRTTSHRSSFHVVDAANQLLENEGFTYEYDANGNLIEKTSKTNGSVTRYTWNTQDQLIKVDMPDGTVAEYTYDPLGRRIQKRVNGVVTKYIYDDEDIIAELDENDIVTTTFVHGPGIDEPVTMTRNGRTYLYHRDALGSITHITDENGFIVQRYEYDSYGNLMSLWDPSFVQPYTYTGRENDPETGLMYYRARYYDPLAGRFISEDPIRFAEGMNVYSYVRNRPNALRDPSGLTTLAPPEANWTTEPPTWEPEVLGGVGPGMGNICVAGGRILTGFTRHGINRLIQRGVSPRALLDALKNPQTIRETANETFKYIGKKATAVLNEAGRLVTTWKK